MAQKIGISQLIEGLRQAGVYDPLTQRKLDLLTSTFEGAAEISQKERVVTQKVFADLIKKINSTGEIRFFDLSEAQKSPGPGRITCLVTDFLGFGNAGPVYSVTVDQRPYALKIYSAEELTETVQLHGKFGLAGVVYDLEREDRPTTLSDLGKKVLRRKPEGVYGRSKRLVKIHKVGQLGNYLFLVMELLAVDPISHVDPTQMGGELLDVVSWAVDCAVGLCHLHVEERRLHLNVRPEAFIRKISKPEHRLPKFTFFNFPKTYSRPENSACLTTEFIMVDHLDNSVEISDGAPKGLGTVGSWPFMPPEAILSLLQILRQDYQELVERGSVTPTVRTIKLKRSQMDDIWALGMTLYQFLSGGRFPFGEPKHLADMVNSILLTKFDFSSIDPRLRDLLASILDKDPKKRFLRVMEGCPEKIQSRRVAAEAILYKLEEIALQLAP